MINVEDWAEIRRLNRAEGIGIKAIARRLGVSVKTVENHKTRLFDKLGVRTQAHAVSLAIGHGLLASAPLPGDDP